MDGPLAIRGASGGAATPLVDDTDPGDRALLVRAFVVPGVLYPAWRLLAPKGSVDPLGVWVAIGLCFLAVPAIHLVRPLSRTTLQNITSGLAAGVTLHLFVLASLNEMSPFYAVGSSLAVLATALFIRSIGLMIAYSAFIGVIGVALFIAFPDETKIAYWGGMIPVLFLAYHRLSIQLAQRSELEQQVAQRTSQLSETNRRLLAEIEERTRLENELRITHKMEAVGRLAGGVAHDFNNLLTTIGVYSELVLGGLPSDSELRNEVRQIQKANSQAASLTQQLLALGRRSHVQVELIDLNEVISDAGAMLRHLLSSDTRLVLNLDPQPQPILGNIDQLQQILINLAINARDAMSEPGQLTIETARCSAWELAEQDVAPLPESDEYVRLSVSDTGSGMDAEARERAFDPFFTTKEPDRGAGLGLSIVHGIVSQADGYLRLQSEQGKGTRFDLFWPLGEAAKHPEEPLIRPVSESRSEKLLLVEDEEDLRVALTRVLTSDGYDVTEAESGEEALEIASRGDTTFDLVVTDVVMPRMSGFELAERLEATHPETQLLLISGHLSDRALEHLPSRLPFLAKPFAASELTERVRELLDERAEGPQA